MQNLKVMQIMPEFELAGAQIMAENLSVMLMQEDVEICVISLYDYKSPITERLEQKNVPLYYLNKKKGLDLKIFLRLYNLMRREKPQVIHTHLYSVLYAVPAAMLARVRVTVHTVHSVADKELGGIHKKICRFFYKFCRLIPVSISPSVQRSVMDVYRLSENRVPMIYNGINLKSYTPKSEYVKSDNIVLLHIGRFTEAKNHALLIESFRIVRLNAPKTVLKLVGSGELENSIRDKVEKLGLSHSVEFLGLKPEVSSYLTNADIFILPSLWEGMPITLIEAMATGLPIVATRVGGIPNMIEDGVTGLLVDIDVEIIAKTLLDLIFDPEKRQRIGRAAYKASVRFSADEMAKKYSNLYFKLLS